MAFPIVFNRMGDPRSTRHEAAGALGDSGGAVFAQKNPLNPNPEWVLAGIIFSVTNRGESLERTTFYSDVTWVVDLSYYREQIMKHMEKHRPKGPANPEELATQSTRERPGLGAAAGLLAALLLIALAWRRRRRPRLSSQNDR
jgi:hypothetical protein